MISVFVLDQIFVITLYVLSQKTALYQSLEMMTTLLYFYDAVQFIATLNTDENLDVTTRYETTI